MTSPAPTPVPRLPIPTGLQLTVRVTQEGQEAAVVLGFLLNNASSPTQALAQALLQAQWNAIRNMTTSTTICTGGTLRSLAASNNVVFELAAPSSPAGIDTTAPTVAAVATLIKWSTANGTRSGKGRTFIPGTPAAWVAAGGRSLTAAAQTVVNQRASEMLSHTAEWPGLQSAVLSFKNGVGYPITGGAPGGRLGIQRKRMR